jgi:folate-binding protein YgfZ
VVEIALAQSEKFTPHMLNLDLLHIVSLDKGCYPGQEIVARTHYRGASKRRCLRFESGEPVNPGDKVSDDERDIGEVVNAIGNDLLAVVPVDAADHALTVGEIRLSRVELPYSINS